MATTGSIKRIAKERGVTPADVVRGAIEEHGSIFKAAVALGVSPNTLQYWIKNLGLRVKFTQRAIVEDATGIGRQS